MRYVLEIAIRYMLFCDIYGVSVALWRMAPGQMFINNWVNTVDVLKNEVGELYRNICHI